MPKVSNEQPFSISVVGDKTKVTYTGEFRAKVILSYREEMLRDRLIRETLGQFPESASPRVRDLAEMFADFAVSFTETPLFWKSSDNGNRLNGDDNLISEVFSKLQALRAEASASTPETDADKEKISKAVAEQDK